MILQALYQYSERLRRYQAEHPDAIDETGEAMASPGMEWKSVPYRIILRPDGSFVDIRSANKEKRLIAKIPIRTRKDTPNILSDYLDYLLGLPLPKKDDPKRDKDRFELFVNKVRSLPNNIRAFRIVKLFYERKEYLRAREHALIKEIQSQKQAVLLSFELEGSMGVLLTEELEVREYLDPTKRENDTLSKGVCLVTGKPNQPIVLTHEKIPVGTGAPLISFQKDSGLDSYFKEQGLNAPISVEASDAIGSALKHLLKKNEPTNYSISGTTYVFWTSLSNNELELIGSYTQATFKGLEAGEEEGEEPEGSSKFKKSKKKPSNDNPRDKRQVEKVLKALKAVYGSTKPIIESKERFYILGLMKNNGRLAVKLFVEGSVREIVGNTLQHIQDMNIVDSKGNLDEEYPHPRSLKALFNQLRPEEQRKRDWNLDKFSQSLMEDFVHSIINNRPYPANVQKMCLHRIHQERSVDEWKAAILKGYLNRKCRQHNKTEIVTMALDKTQTKRAYLAGRLFAVLEKIQEDAHYWASGIRLKSTIRTRYYGMASTYPSIIFGRLINLSVHHMNKLTTHNSTRAKKLREEQEAIFSLIPGGRPEFPIRFSPDDQSLFAVGYYHQRTDLWAKEEDKVR